jgi:anti-sigma factor RsiW
VNCRHFIDELCDYLDGESDAGRAEEAGRHLKGCRKCRIVCETTRQTVLIYRRAWATYAVPAEVEARLMAAVERCCNRPLKGGPKTL